LSLGDSSFALPTAKIGYNTKQRRCDGRDLKSDNGTAPVLVRALEVVMSEHEWKEEDVEEVADATEELFGHTDVEPSLYTCNVCARDWLAEELRWSRDGEARCPVCGQALNLV
jgi:rubrerythrin